MWLCACCHQCTICHAFSIYNHFLGLLCFVLSLILFALYTKYPKSFALIFFFCKFPAGSNKIKRERESSLAASASVWPDFAIVGKIKILGNFQGYNLHLETFRTNYGNFLCYWANFHCCKWINTEQLVYPSGHTASASSWIFLSAIYMLIQAMIKNGSC